MGTYHSPSSSAEIKTAYSCIYAHSPSWSLRRVFYITYWRYLMFKRSVVLLVLLNLLIPLLFILLLLLLLVSRVGLPGFEDEGSTILRNIKEEQSSERALHSGMSESCTLYLFLAMVQSTTFSSKRLSYYTGQKDAQRLRSYCYFLSVRVVLNYYCA